MKLLLTILLTFSSVFAASTDMYQALLSDKMVKAAIEQSGKQNLKAIAQTKQMRCPGCFEFVLFFEEYQNSSVSQFAMKVNSRSAFTPNADNKLQFMPREMSECKQTDYGMVCFPEGKVCLDSHGIGDGNPIEIDCFTRGSRLCNLSSNQWPTCNGGFKL